MRHATSFSMLAVAGLLTLVGCGGSSDDSPTVAQGAQVTSSTTTGAVASTNGSAAPTSTPTTAGAASKVSANSASRAEMQAAFEAAGISNAARWAMEVEEYRPYPTNDPTIAKLRQNLAKYNPAPGLVDQIVATLSL
jgi:hypothetical protein